MADLEGLKEFVKSSRGNRGGADFFVGRKEELALIEDACIRAVERKSSSDPGERGNEPGGVLFSGVPGMGKTALLAEGCDLAQGVYRGRSGEETQEPPRIVKAVREKIQIESFGTPLIIWTAPGELKTEAEFLSLCSREAHWLRKRAGTKSLAPGVGILDDQFTWDDPARVLGELGKIDVLKKPLVVLMIDEAQGSNENNTEVYENLCLGLYPFPTVPVFGGLLDSRAALESAGISRFARGHYVELPMLDDGDCAEAMEAMLDRYEIGVPEGKRREWVNLVVEHSERFAHHLNTALIATARAAIQNGGELNSGMIAEIEQAIKKVKDGYYSWQLVGFQHGEEKVAAQIVMEATQEGKDPAELARELLPDLPAPRRNKHGDIDIAGFVQHMEHNGMLRWVDDEDRYECPIPSFHAWLQRKYGKRDT